MAALCENSMCPYLFFRRVSQEEMRPVLARAEQLQLRAAQIDPLHQRLAPIITKAPEQRRRDGEEQLVDQPGRDQLPEESRSSLDEDALVSRAPHRIDDPGRRKGPGHHDAALLKRGVGRINLS